jgi:hypothetical protein
MTSKITSVVSPRNPILLAGIGYTRYFASPQDAAEAGAAQAQVTLRAYPPVEGKIPIYAARNTTEAIFYELDPYCVAAYLDANVHCSVPVSARSNASSPGHGCF